MLTGEPPFYSPNREELISKIRNEEIFFPRYLSLSVQDLLQKLLVKDPEQRLGSCYEGASEIKNHPWFDGFEWDSLLSKEVRAPFVPVLKRETDVSNFDPVKIFSNYFFNFLSFFRNLPRYLSIRSKI